MSDVTTIEADVPERYADAVSTRLQRAADEDVVGRSGARTARCGRPRARPRSPTGSAGWTSPTASARTSPPTPSSPRACAPRATATRSCSAWAARASPPRSSASPSASSTTASRLHVLDSTHPAAGPRGPQPHRPRPRADDRLLQVGRDDRADVDVQGLLRSARATARTTPPSPTRARRSRSWPASTASGASSHGDPDIGGRYSALSPFGLVPAAAAGIDLGAILDSAIGAAEECRGEHGNAGPVAGLRARRARAARAATS